jgi:hypothetical protein
VVKCSLVSADNAINITFSPQAASISLLECIPRGIKYLMSRDPSTAKYGIQLKKGEDFFYSLNVCATGCCGRIADMTVPEGGIKPAMASLSLL